MRVSTIASLSTLLAGNVLAQGPVTGKLGNATVVTNNPVGKEIRATLPEQAFWKTGSLDGNVKGSISVKSSPNGVGVEYTVKFSNLPKEGGPFTYHIHDKVVPADGNCTATAAHLDPFVRGEDPVCDSKLPETCQVGDLSGKYGKITSDPFEAKYHDEFSSLNVGVNNSIPDRSFVIHFSNKTRISCANFAGSGYGNSTPTYATTGGIKPTTQPSSQPSSSPITAGALTLSPGVLIQSFFAVGVAAAFLV
ncbi:hypothetical protein JX265_006240 [Neoarthrinium moseri]|uniref:superoxide dismutase n=1 Tax=Neoarthrinium moseri TaxID=1658444 RepID=A0A9P9WM51_9PEZI|nr:hypothetical protein JX266_013798 [Neoarthrinium moseri]KAI1870070.1 hypothetical protein JX265_006240 [Neoarthrinium moseri]